ncbi:pkinase-domain-containing protein [Phaffia rhodozyma]|uniref:Pkinase-domain-containing protein n=1 Tax=Phaffia rhodozyma TaxID=264483 RepID=A0A0F7SSJ0_PHARH|nr:pkinase-domain-containing protein [Phaffia rhodozyma]
MSQQQTVPCQYKTGKTLGSGTYAIVKEAVHIVTGKYYACKIISKKLMEGREHMVRNEIEVLKRVSQGHPNIVGLIDYFETRSNLYLVFDLCTGGELFDRICAKGSYYERDAAHLVYVVTSAVKYLHNVGIVHRDLKPENLIFADKSEESDLLIADFGLSRIMKEEQFNLLTTTCGTPGYMAPEIFKKSGHGKPVDIWAIGVISYFLLAGYTPFDRNSQTEEMQAIIRADFSFTPAEYWSGVSDVAKDFIKKCLTVDPAQRLTAEQALEHPWLSQEAKLHVADTSAVDLLPNVKSNITMKRTLRGTVKAMIFAQRLSATQDPVAQEMRTRLDSYKREAEEDDPSQVLKPQSASV